MRDEKKPLRKPQKKRADWVLNHEKILECYSSYLKTKGRIPTSTEIMEETGMERPTILNHLKVLRSDEDVVNTMAVLNGKMVAAVFKTGYEGNPKSQELWFKMQGYFDQQNRDRAQAESEGALRDAVDASVLFKDKPGSKNNPEDTERG